MLQNLHEISLEREGERGLEIQMLKDGQQLRAYEIQSQITPLMQQNQQLEAQWQQVILAEERYQQELTKWEEAEYFRQEAQLTEMVRRRNTPTDPFVLSFSYWVVSGVPVGNRHPDYLIPAYVVSPNPSRSAIRSLVGE